MSFPQTLSTQHRASMRKACVEMPICARHEPVAAEVFVEGTLNFTGSEDGQSEWYIHNPEPGLIERTPDMDPQRVRIFNARLQFPVFALDRAGFQLVGHDTELCDFSDDSNVRSTYYAEMEQLVKKSVGASDVIVFDHNIRSSEHNIESEVLRQPSTSVHADYTESSAPRRVRQLLPADEAERRLARPFSFINVWKPLDQAVHTRPLAVCDARTMKREDFVRTTLRYRDRTGEIYTFRSNAEQRWYYYPLMHPDEVLLLKCYDSETDGRARFVAHTSFEDPTSLPDAPARKSIEVRTIAFFE